MKTRLSRFLIELSFLLRNEEAQDLIEYALVVALVAFGATAAMGTLASKITNAYTQITTTLTTTIT
jgi:pilus assembly protein Flp/PilA